MMTIDEMIAVLQAAKAGKAMQRSHIFPDGHHDWVADGTPSWNFFMFDYRVKPEPREWTLHKPDDPTLSALGNMNAVPYDPGRGTKCMLTECHPVRVREVLP